MVRTALPSATPVAVTILSLTLTAHFPGSEDTASTFTGKAAFTIVAVMSSALWVNTVTAFLSSRITMAPLMVTTITAFPAVSGAPFL